MELRYLFIKLLKMKLSELKQLIKESVKKALTEAPANATLTVNNLSQANLYNAEISGQLSDGAWENARPADHWQVWSGINVKIGSPIGYSGIYPRRTKYALANQLLPYVGARMLVYGAAGLAKLDLNQNTSADLNYALENFFEVFNTTTAQQLVAVAKTKTYEEFMQAFTEKAERSNYFKKYIQIIEKNNSKVKLTYEMIAGGQYNVNTLKNDLKDISLAMQTKIQ
jgi:hypothetical protein